jgi:FkbM family methyltransferase
VDVGWHLRKHVWTPIDNRMRRHRAIMFYRSFVRPGDLVFDVGANFGTWTQLLLKAGARVIAIEPQPGIFKERRATLEQVALGRERGELQLRSTMDPGVSGLSTLSDEWPELLTRSGRVPERTWAETTTSVAVVTLDDLLDKHGVPAYIKIDTEGWDAHVLAGLSQPVRHVSFEYLPEAQHVADAAIAELARLGDYRLRFLPEEQWLPSAWPPSRPVWGDVFAELTG